MFTTTELYLFLCRILWLIFSMTIDDERRLSPFWRFAAATARVGLGGCRPASPRRALCLDTRGARRAALRHDTLPHHVLRRRDALERARDGTRFGRAGARSRGAAAGCRRRGRGSARALCRGADELRGGR